MVDDEDDGKFLVIAADYVAKESAIDRRKVSVYFHNMVGEYCIEIDGKWRGYIDPATMKFDI